MPRAQGLRFSLGLIDEEVYITPMKAVIANLIIAFGFLRKEVPTGCCHAYLLRLIAEEGDGFSISCF